MCICELFTIFTYETTECETTFYLFELLAIFSQSEISIFRRLPLKMATSKPSADRIKRCLHLPCSRDIEVCPFTTANFTTALRFAQQVRMSRVSATKYMVMSRKLQTQATFCFCCLLLPVHPGLGRLCSAQCFTCGGWRLPMPIFIHRS